MRQGGDQSGAGFALLLCALALLAAVGAALLARRAHQLSLPAPSALHPRALPPGTETLRDSSGTLALALEPVLRRAAEPCLGRFSPSAKDVLLPFAEPVPAGEPVPEPGRAQLEIDLLVTLEFAGGRATVAHAEQAHEGHGGPGTDGQPEAHLKFRDEEGRPFVVEADICEIARCLLPAFDEQAVPFAAEPGRRKLVHALRLPLPDLAPKRLGGDSDLGRTP